MAADLAKAYKGTAFSPVLLIRCDLTAGVPARTVDRYHRVCGSGHLDEYTDIPRHIANPQH